MEINSNIPKICNMGSGMCVSTSIQFRMAFLLPRQCGGIGDSYKSSATFLYKNVISLEMNQWVKATAFYTA